MKVCDAKLKVGDIVRTNGDSRGTCEMFEGVVGEINEENFYVWQDIRSGARGNIISETKGYKYSWSISLHNNVAEIEIISNKTFMSNILDFYKNLTATSEEKLLKKYGIEDPIGTPTEEGLKLSALISYKTNRGEVIEIAKTMAKEQEEKK